jgi:glutathione synthase/RimK-type ligase-like ATP-grasp enzyme
LKIETDSEGGTTTLRLIGRLQAEHVAQLKKEIEDSSAERVCLREVTLVDVDVVQFLTACEEGGVTVVNCSAYIREWMDRERQQKD